MVHCISIFIVWNCYCYCVQICCCNPSRQNWLQSRFNDVTCWRLNHVFFSLFLQIRLTSFCDVLKTSFVGRLSDVFLQRFKDVFGWTSFRRLLQTSIKRLSLMSFSDVFATSSSWRLYNILSICGLRTIWA